MSTLHTLKHAAAVVVTVIFILGGPLTGPGRCAPDSAGQEMRGLEQEGKLTVRALRGWNMLPRPFMQLAMSLHGSGIDILGADLQEIEALAHKAKSADPGALAGHAEALEALAGYMKEFAARQTDAQAAPSPDGTDHGGGPQTASTAPLPVAKPVQDSDLLGIDEYDWRKTPDLQAEKQAIGQRQNDFRQAMDRKDIPGATALIAEDRRDVYATLFASNPEAMPSFGALFESARITFLSPPAETEQNARLRTAEYALDLDGFTFYVRWMKDGDTWFLADF